MVRLTAAVVLTLAGVASAFAGVVPVPEPANAAELLIGLAGVFFLIKRRR